MVHLVKRRITGFVEISELILSRLESGKWSNTGRSEGYENPSWMKKIIQKSDEEGKFKDRLFDRHRISHITYRSLPNDWTRPSHVITFEEFQKLGRPWELYVCVSAEYVPRDGSQEFSDGDTRIKIYQTCPSPREVGDI